MESCVRWMYRGTKRLMRRFNFKLRMIYYDRVENSCFKLVFSDRFKIFVVVRDDMVRILRQFLHIYRGLCKYEVVIVYVIDPNPD